MQTLKKYGFLPMILLIALFVPTACTPDDPPGGQDDTGTDSEQIHPAGTCDWDNLRLNIPVALFTDNETPLINSIIERAPNAADIDQAELILISSARLEPLSEQIIEAYKRGATIAVFTPHTSSAKSWFDNNNITYVAQPDEQLLVYAFNNRMFSYTADFVAPESKPTIFKHNANNFIYWVNQATRSSRSENSAMLQDIAKSQSICHTYNIRIDNALMASVIFSDKDYLSKESAVLVTYNVYPMHAFQTANSSGDYYLVESQIVAHNGGMYNGVYTSKHGGVVAHLCGFYLSKLNFETSILDSKNNSPSQITYPAGTSPQPSTTVGETQYQKGFSWSLSGNVTAGVEDGALVATAGADFSVGWDNSEVRNLSDLEIFLNSSNNKVAYEYKVNNLPKDGGPAKGSPEPPAISRADMDMYSSWVWYIPSVKDYSSDKFKLQFSMNPEYKGYHWYSSGADFAELGPWSALEKEKRTITRELLPPSRVPTGEIKMTNASNSHRYVDEIKFYKINDNGTASSTPDYVIDQAISTTNQTGPTESSQASIILPVGKYRAECIMYNIDAAGKRTDLISLTTPDNTPLNVKIGETLTVEASTRFAPVN